MWLLPSATITFKQLETIQKQDMVVYQSKTFIYKKKLVGRTKPVSYHFAHTCSEAMLFHANVIGTTYVILIF